MKLVMSVYIYNEIIKLTAVDINGKHPDYEAAEKDFDLYLQWAYMDFKKYHLRNNALDFCNYDDDQHDELCSWCNYHAYIYDVCIGTEDLICMDKSITTATGCDICLAKTSWYKRLI